MAYVLKLSISLIPIQGITTRVLAVKHADRLRLFFMEPFLSGNSQAGRRPHIRNVHVLVPVIVEIEPACAHACSDVLNSRFCGDRREFPIAAVAVQIVSPEVVGHVQIRRAVGVVVAPGARETKAVVIRV